MSKIRLMALGILALCLLPLSAWAGSNPWGDWQGNWQFQDSATAQEQLNAASQQYFFQHPGLLGVQQTTNIGTMNQTINGSVSNAGSTNVVNANSTTIDAHGAYNSMVTVTNKQSSESADQTAVSTVVNP